ncbi:MAG: RsmD family RNA methyltransferase [Synergistaceae bacterium]|nr:RsmD family RNA methyltransferase [Synergistaceae bacterium]
MKEMRPTTGKVMLALFNILGNIRGRSFLDLFSGSGQIALTAAKKGAAPVVCVESERARHAAIVKKAPADVKCLCADVRRAVARMAKKGECFDIIFADPPYNLGWGEELPRLLAGNENISAPGGVIIFEHSEEEEPAAMDETKWKREDRKYGGTVLSFYSRRNEND